MPLDRVPASVADEMVEILFANGYPRSQDGILYPGCGDGALVEAVHRYCDGAGALSEPPGGVAVDVDTDRLAAVEERFDDVETIGGDFLTRELSLPDTFDYVVCNPPTVAWSDLTRERQREYAANFPRIIVGDEAVDEDVLFLEQAIRHLAPDGRAVFVTSSALATAEEAAGLRDRHYDLIEDVFPLSPDEFPALDGRYALTVVSNDPDEENVMPYRYDATEYEAMLADRVETDRPFVAEAVMTKSPDGYHPDTSISDAFFDLLYRDYEAAPVYRDPEARTGVEGFVSRESIRTNDGATVAHQQQELTDRYLLDRGTPLEAVIDRLAEERFQFVGNPDEVAGIITRFDLNREPIYLHLFDCFSDFEIGLRNLVRREAPDWEETTDVYIGSRPEEHLFADRLACGKLGKLIDIVESVGIERSIRADLAGYDTTLGDLKKLRDSIAHFNPIVHTMSEASTADAPERGARQFAREYRFLQVCVEGLAE